MYRFPYYTEKDKSKVLAFIKENYFAVITGWDGEYPVATQIPLEILDDEAGLLLRGHMMKNTDHHKAFEKNDKVMVLFTGPHTYISASWYTDPRQGSTWNYMTVQAKGIIEFKDEAATYEAVKDVTDKHEPGSSASFDKLPDSYVQNLVKAIVAFEIRVESLENVFKLSQNRDKESQQNIIEQLLLKNTDHARAIAKEMMERL